MPVPFWRSANGWAADAAREPDTQAASNLAALSFLERSRDVASETVIDCASAQTSTSERENTSDPGPWTPLR